MTQKQWKYMRHKLGLRVRVVGKIKLCNKNLFRHIKRICTVKYQFRTRVMVNLLKYTLQKNVCVAWISVRFLYNTYSGETRVLRSF